LLKFWFQKIKWRKSLPLICFLFPLLLYLNSIPNQYNLDDELVTCGHRLTARGISAIPDIFTSPYYEDEHGYSYGYRPMVLTSFALEHSFFGENAHISHLVNVLLYAITVVLLFFCLIQLLQGYNIILPFLATMFFACHPLHTEVVCSIKNRDEILALLFGLLALYAALQHISKKQTGFFVLAIFSFTLAVFSKQSILSFAVLIPIALMLFRKINLMEAGKYSLLLGIISALVIPNLTAAAQVKYALAIASAPLLLSGFLNWQELLMTMKRQLKVLLGKEQLLLQNLKKNAVKALRIVLSDYGYILLLAPASIISLAFDYYLLFVFFISLAGIAHHFSMHRKFNLITIFVPLLLLLLPIDYDAFSILPLACYFIAFAHFNNVKINPGLLLSLMVAAGVAVYDAYPEKDILILLVGLAGFTFLTINVFRWKQFLPLVSPIAILPIYLIKGEEVPSMPIAFILFLFILPGGWWFLSQLSERFGTFCKTHQQGFFLLVSYAALNACSAFTDWFILNVIAGVIVIYALVITAKSKRDYVHFFFGAIILAIVIFTTKIYSLIYPIAFMSFYLVVGFWGATRGFKPKLTILLWLMVPLYFLVNEENINYHGRSFPNVVKQQLEHCARTFFNEQNHGEQKSDLQLDQSPAQTDKTILSGSLRPIEFVENPLQWDTPYGQKLATCLFTMGVYIQKMVIPHPLLFYYGYKKIDLKKLSDPWVIVILFIHIGLFVVMILYLRKWPAFSFGIMTYLISIFLFSNYLTPVPGIVGERLTFVASFGFCLALAAFLSRVSKQTTSNKISSFRQVKPALIAVVTCILFLYSVKTFSRNNLWHDPLKLMQHDIQHLAYSAQANNMLASNLMSTYGNQPDTQLALEAVRYFEHAIAIYTDNFNVWFDLGRTYLILDQKDKALEAFISATRIDQTVSKPLINAALLLEEKGSFKEAIPYLKQAIRIEPQTINLYTTLSFLHFRTGNIQESIEVNLQALKVTPYAYEPIVNLGKTYLYLGENDKAREYFEKALQINPNNRELSMTLENLKTEKD